MDNRTKSSFEKIGEDQVEKNRNSSASKSTQSNSVSSNRNRMPSFVRFADLPNTVSEFVNNNEFLNILCSGFIFIHNKKYSSEHLIANIFMKKLISFEFEFLQTHSVGLVEIYDRIKELQKKTGHAKRIFIIESTKYDNYLLNFCTQIAFMEKRNFGVWLQGFVKDLNPQTITLFDSLVLFDMSILEIQLLKSSITINNDDIRFLRKSESNLLDDSLSEGMNTNLLCFINYSRLKSDPIFGKNPIQLYQII